jgi:hypothetical protein
VYTFQYEEKNLHCYCTIAKTRQKPKLSISSTPDQHLDLRNLIFLGDFNLPAIAYRFLILSLRKWDINLIFGQNISKKNAKNGRSVSHQNLIIYSINHKIKVIQVLHFIETYFNSLKEARSISDPYSWFEFSLN